MNPVTNLFAPSSDTAEGHNGEKAAALFVQMEAFFGKTFNSI